jgi:hypothetical protein
MVVSMAVAKVGMLVGSWVSLWDRKMAAKKVQLDRNKIKKSIR